LRDREHESLAADSPVTSVNFHGDTFHYADTRDSRNLFIVVDPTSMKEPP
jgi:hypothetical protein